MIDHTGVLISDFKKRKAFHQQALAPIGYSLIAEIPASITGHSDVAGFGKPPKQDFWIAGGAPNTNKPPIYIAIRVGSRRVVDAFYKAAIAAGGKDNGAPGLCLHYHPDYYGAFSLDSDSHNIQAVCQELG